MSNGLRGNGSYVSNLACLAGAGTTQTLTGGGSSTLAEDMVADVLTIDDYTLFTGGYTIYCNKLILKNGGYIEHDGGAGVGGGGSAAGGTGSGGNTCGEGKNGGAGHTGAGDAGGSWTLYSIAEAGGGAGGNAGGAGGTSVFDASIGTPFQHMIRDTGIVAVDAVGSAFHRVTGGAGGGGGTGDSGAVKGGGGGGGAGVIRIYANEIWIYNGHIQANGGVGGAGGGAGAGGGGGGGGGAILMVCGQAFLASGASSKLTVAGGLGGVGAAGSGTNGAAGFVYIWSELGVQRHLSITGVDFAVLPG